MWMRLVKAHLKPDAAAELVGSSADRDQNDPVTVYMIVPFDGEQDSVGQDDLGPIQELVAEVLDELPDLADVTVVSDYERP